MTNSDALRKAITNNREARIRIGVKEAAEKTHLITVGVKHDSLREYLEGREKGTK